MKYYTGTVNSFADLETTIKGICTTDLGWAINNGILSKNGVFVQLADQASNYAPYRRLAVNAGDGESGGALTNAYNVAAAIIECNGYTISWPATYFIHAFTDTDDGADEVYCVLRHNVEYYQTVAFGKSTVVDAGGTGAWFTASGSVGATRTDRARGYLSSSGATTDPVSGGIVTGPSYSDIGVIGGLFWTQNVGASYQSTGVGAVNHAVDGVARWYHGARSIMYISGIYTALPPLLNDAHVLLPMRAIYPRTNNRLAIIQQHKFARWARNDHVLPEGVIEYGPDKWKVYPYWRRNGAVRSFATSDNDHSGTYAFALKYPAGV